ncbi:secreted Ly-6/uPAR-related protein 1-like [Dromiciops gliroides]|uniref:secreted Ly-6/uPAR-related protein 1-like n=1 Tax=Dromiciops gliroides TaxID=33562 RepID=UPI001CC59BE5|nr:secreted Ly-6/uPAR-related protein 1-like [Dromiciops gliroides]
MDSLWLVLLVTATYVAQGNTLKCYTCKEPTDIYECRNISTCNHWETSCKTQLENVESEYPFYNNAKVTRSCSYNCVATDPDTIGLAHPVSCCYRDLCNTDSATGDGTKPSALLRLTVLASFLCLISLLGMVP